MFEYVCDHVIPGCTHKETGETAEAVRDKARSGTFTTTTTSIISTPIAASSSMPPSSSA